MYTDEMSFFNVLLISSILAITTAYPAGSPYYEYIHPLNPYSLYPAELTHPYEAPISNGGQLFSDDEFPEVPFVPLPSAPSASPKHVQMKIASQQKEEFYDVIEDVLKLLIEKRLCEVSNANNAPVAKRSVDENLAAKATPAEHGTFTQQQLAFLSNLKPEDIQQLIKLLIPPPVQAANRTLPVHQELPPEIPQQLVPHLEAPTFYMPPLWQPAPLQASVLPSPYIQNQVIPVHQYQPIISYEPLQPAGEDQVHIIKPYMESPVAPPMFLNGVPPVSSPFVYTFQISAPLHTNQAIKPSVVAPISQVVFKPATLKPDTKVETVTPKPQANSLAEKLESIFSQSRILLDEKNTSTEKNQVDLGNSPTKPEAQSVENPSDNGVEGTGRSAAEVSSGWRVSELETNEQLLEVFKAIRDDLMNNPCKVMKPQRRAVNERSNGDYRKPMYTNNVYKHAIPPATLPSRRHNAPARIQYHRFVPHTLLHSGTWQ